MKIMMAAKEYDNAPGATRNPDVDDFPPSKKKTEVVSRPKKRNRSRSVSGFYSYGSCQNENCVQCAINRGEVNEEIAGFIRLMLGQNSNHIIVRSPVHYADWPGTPEGKYWDEGGSWADWSRRVIASAKREKTESRELEAIVAPASPLVSAGGISSQNGLAHMVVAADEPISSRAGRPKKYASRSEQMKAYRERKSKTMEISECRLVA